MERDLALRAEPAQPARTRPPKFERIAIAADMSTRIDGRGTPGRQVLIRSDDRLVASAVADATGAWSVRVSPSGPSREVALQAASETDAAGFQVFGDDVRIALPSAAGESILVAHSETPMDESADVETSAVGRVNDIDSPSARERLAQAESEGPPAGKAEGGEEPSSEQSPGMLQPLWDWLERAARSYQGRVVKELSRPEPEAGSTGDTETESAGKPAAAPGTAAAKDTPDEAARRIAEERRKADEIWRRIEQRVERADRDDAERAAKSDEAARRAEAAKAKEERKRKEEEARARINQGLKELESAKVEADERKRLKEESERSAGEALDAAKAKQAEAARAAEERARQKREAAAREAAVAAATREAKAREAEAARQRETAAASEDEPERKPAPARAAALTVPDVTRDEVRLRPRAHRIKVRHLGKACRPASKRMVRRTRIHVVQPGESLWSIARRYYRDGNRSAALFRANRRRLSDPDIIRPCAKLVLPKRGLRV